LIAVSTDQVVASLGRLFDCLESRDLDGAMTEVRSISDPGLTFTSIVGSAVEGRTYDGFDGIRAWFADLTGAFDVDYSDREFRRGGRTITFLSNLTLTGRGSGVEVTQPVATVFELDDRGLIARGETLSSQDEVERRVREIDDR
jgi:hypothetical protein